VGQLPVHAVHGQKENTKDYKVQTVIHFTYYTSDAVTDNKKISH